MSDYPQATEDDPRPPLAAILGDALVGLKSSVTIEDLHGEGLYDVGALVRTEDGRAFTITVRREYVRDRRPV